MADVLRKPLLYTYGVPDFAFVLMVNMEVYYFSAFLTDFAQFSLTTLAWILGVTSVVDIVCSLAAGVVLQKVTLRFGGKYRSWFLVGPPAVAVLFLLQFTKLGTETVAALIIIIGFLSSHLIWNIVVTAGGAMLGRLSPIPRERNILSASRAQGMSAAGLVFAATAPPMMSYFSRYTSDITGMTITVGVYNLLMILGYWYIYKMTAGKDPYDEIADGRAKDNSVLSIMGMVRLAVVNPPLLGLIFAEIFRSTYVLIITAYAFYYFKYVLNELPLMTLFIMALSIARLSGTTVASWIGNTIGKRRTYCASLVLAAMGFGTAIFWSDNVYIFTSIYCVASMLGMIAGSMSTVLFSDTVVYGEWKTGKNNRAFTMALQSFSIKVAILIRSGVLAIGLPIIGFEANTIPAPSVVDGIRNIMIFAPTITCILAALLFFFRYRMNDSQVVIMQQEIDARKSGN